MRTLLRIVFDVAASNKSIKEGSLPAILQSTMDRLRPEASYFHTIDGCRACFMVFDMKDPSEMPVIAEPFFTELNAKVDFCPVMNADDLQKGLKMREQQVLSHAN
jgi:hypothetical protein